MHDPILTAKDFFDRSIRLANEDYLDRLDAVYAFAGVAIRPAALRDIMTLAGHWDAGRHEEVVREFLDKGRFRKFPVEHPLATLLRDYPRVILNNPQAVRKLTAYIVSMGLSGQDLADRLLEPAAPSRKTNGFHTWSQAGLPLMVNGAKTRVPVQSEVDNNIPGPYIVRGADDNALEVRARRYLGVEREKGIDLLARARSGIWCIGEAKLVTTTGGGQNKSMDELVNFFKLQRPGVLAVAILDGYPWHKLATSGWRGDARIVALYNEVAKGNLVVSALLIPALLEAL